LQVIVNQGNAPQNEIFYRLVVVGCYFPATAAQKLFSLWGFFLQKSGFSLGRFLTATF